jgi:hypothetical protein
MGVDYSAVVVVGQRLDEAAVSRLESKKEMVRACSHELHESAKFCHECGNPRFREKEVKGIDLHELAHEAGLEYTYTGNMYSGEHDIFVGLDVETGSNRGCCDAVLLDFDSMDIPSLKEKVKVFLEKYDLWNEKEFGIWSALNVS